MKKNLFLFFGLFIFAHTGYAQFVIDTIQPPCFTGCSGRAHVSPKIAGYSYVWNNSINGVNGTSLCAGPIYCVVRNSSNVVVDTVRATIPTTAVFWGFPSVYAANTNTTCNPPYTGDMIVHAHGGMPGFTYAWNDGYTSQDSVRPMITDAYNVTVTDANGCSVSALGMIASSLPLQIYTQTMRPATNCTTSDGELSLNVQGGGYPYTILWDDGSTGYSNYNLDTGNHSVTVTDLFNCSVAYTDSVSYWPLFPNKQVEVIGNCNGRGYGEMSLNGLQTNYPPLTYLWSTGNIYNSISASPGEHSLTVTDGLGCIQVFTDTIFSGNFLVDTVIVDATTCMGNDGMATANVTGTPPYTYAWTNGFGSFGNSNTASFLQPGAYYLSVNDDIGCSAYIAFNITSHVQFTHSETPLTCQGLGTSTFNLQANANGYMINWGDGTAVEYTSIAVPTATHNYTLSGNYIVYIEDILGFCSDSIAITIANQGVVIDTNVIEYPGCLHPGGGQISVSANGPQAPYSYNWSNGIDTNTITHLPAGTYILTITDNAGCQRQIVFTLPQVNSFSYYGLVLANATACNDSNGVATIHAYGGNRPYTYLWNTTPPQTNDTAVGLSAGIYNVSVTDSLGCITTAHVTVDDGCLSQITGLLYIDSNNCLFDSTDVPVVGALVTAWHNGQFYYGTTDSLGYYSITAPDTGLYQVTANLANNLCLAWGCNSAPRTVNVNSLGMAFTGNDFVYSYDSINPSFNLVVHPGWSASIPGSPKDFWFYAFGPGSNTNTLYTFTFTFDSALTFISSDIPYTTYNAVTRTIQWINVPSYFIGRIHFTVALSTPLNYIMQNYFLVTQNANECNIADNSILINEPVTGSRDPNSKEVQPAGELTDADSVLIYTIHFQNNGNDTTWFITLLDTLQPELDPASVVNLASSHTYTEFSISGPGILRWVFNPVYLPDSATNPLGSQGFVMFSIKRKPGLVPGHAVNNTAHIYFDYNDAVVTNTASSIIATPVGINAPGMQGKVTTRAFPNPFSTETHILVTGAAKGSSIQVSDVTGKQMMHLPLPENGLVNIQRDKLSSGIYFYAVLTNGRQMATGRIVAE